MGYKKKSDLAIIEEMRRRLIKKIRQKSTSASATANLTDSLTRLTKLKVYIENLPKNDVSLPEINTIQGLDLDLI